MFNESTKLKGDSETLKIKLDRVGRDLNFELDTVRRLEDESEQVNIYATIFTSPIC